MMAWWSRVLGDTRRVENSCLGVVGIPVPDDYIQDIAAAPQHEDVGALVQRLLADKFPKLLELR